MKKILQSVIFVMCVNGTYAMDETAQGREIRGYALNAVRRADVINVSFNDADRNLLTKTIDVTALIEGSNPIDESLRGIDIQKDRRGELFLSITRDFSLLDQTKGFVLNFPEGNVRFNGDIQCNFMEINLWGAL
jgi:hypothetical protein